MRTTYCIALLALLACYLVLALGDPESRDQDDDVTEVPPHTGLQEDGQIHVAVEEEDLPDLPFLRRKRNRNKKGNKKKKKGKNNGKQKKQKGGSTQTPRQDQSTLSSTDEKQNQLIQVLSRQVMLQQLFLEERIRSDGSSGIKQLRLNRDGPQPYFSPHHSSTKSFMAMHDHANNIRTIGMGEVIAVMNGVEFRTRHNDFSLKKPADGGDYHDTQEIEFPDVPQEVLNAGSIDEQINEMRLWFKAFKDQDYSQRDYRKYFKANLCYLEGAWTNSDENIDEPFVSDRHLLDAKTWQELQEKIRFTSYTGKKSASENFAFLPVTIMGFRKEDNTPIFAQWNYRILCHPLKDDLPTRHLQLIDDLAPRFANKYRIDEYKMSRTARFQLNDQPPDEERIKKYTLLDKVMSEIPGKDNYGGYLNDTALGDPAQSLDPHKTDGEPLNAAYYHRKYKVFKAGAMGLVTRSRGYSDRCLFVALNNRSEVAGMSLEACKGRGRKKVCETVQQKVSYAMPIEVLYTTPLSKWNPYGLLYKGEAKFDLGKTVNALNSNGERRTGKLTPDRAFDGTNSKYYYRTPADFFKRQKTTGDPADTSRFVVGVLDPDGNVQKVRASGHRIFLPEIEDVGIIRQRYPIAPVHGEGSAVWKELEALKDAVMDMASNIALYRETTCCGEAAPTLPPPKVKVYFTTSLSRSDTITPHHHTFWLYQDDVDALKLRGRKQVETDAYDMQHIHVLIVKWNKTKKRWMIFKCDDGTSDITKGPDQTRCFDQHDKWADLDPDKGGSTA